MATRPFTFDADEELVAAYEKLPADMKEKVLLLQRLTFEAGVKPRWQSLEEAGAELGPKAQANGMTPAILESILRGD